MKINVYLDDLRPCPQGFVLARNVKEAFDVMDGKEIGIISLDHDLGMEDGKILPTGYDFVKMICEQGVKCDEIYLHTANPVGRENMYQTLKGAQVRGFISNHIKIFKHGKY